MMKALRRMVLVLLITAMAMSMAVPCLANADETIAEARRGVVRIFSYDEQTGRCGFGSGFGVGKAGEETQYFVTNWHVVTEEGQQFPTYIILNNNAVTFRIDPETGEDHVVHIDWSQLIPCELLYVAEEYPDVAILKAEKKVPGRMALTLRGSRDLKIGEQVYSLGYPGAADYASLSMQDGTYIAYGDVESVHINTGAVSKLAPFELYGNSYLVEHDAHINEGNSGGPLVDAKGNVVGINTYGLKVDAFLNYSVFIDYAMDILNQLEIGYDYVGMDMGPQIPMAAIIAAAVIAVGLVAALIVIKRKPVPTSGAQDTGLRVQFSSGASLPGKRYVINGTLRFGRAEDCSIRFADNTPGISGHHCEIVVENGGIYLRDLNSRHGTFVNGSRIASNVPMPLAVGTKVSLGSQKEAFEIVRSTKN